MANKRAIWTILLVCLASPLNVYARQSGLEISIALEETKFVATNLNAPLKIKITNKTAQIVNTEKLPGILFYFSKCRAVGENCPAAPKNTYVGGVDIKPKILKKDAFVEFEVNLTELSWNDAHAPVLDFSRLGTMSLIPEGAYFFYAEIRVFDKTAKPNETPRFTRFLSNEIEVKLERLSI
jgi:hypothetical protein